MNKLITLIWSLLSAQHPWLLGKTLVSEGSEQSPQTAPEKVLQLGRAERNFRAWNELYRKSPLPLSKDEKGRSSCLPSTSPMVLRNPDSEPTAACRNGLRPAVSPSEAGDHFLVLATSAIRTAGIQGFGSFPNIPVVGSQALQNLKFLRVGPRNQMF